MGAGASGSGKMSLNPAPGPLPFFSELCSLWMWSLGRLPLRCPLPTVASHQELVDSLAPAERRLHAHFPAAPAAALGKALSGLAWGP